MTPLRLAVPPVTRQPDSAYRLGLVVSYPLVVSGFSPCALLIGAIVGLLILGERDAGTLTAPARRADRLVAGLVVIVIALLLSTFASNKVEVWRACERSALPPLASQGVLAGQLVALGWAGRTFTPCFSYDH